jgi:hypothetical protein
VRHNETVRAAELELMTSPTRRNGPRLQTLLHEDFVEIGRSGRRWTRAEMVASLADEGDRSVSDVDEWEFVSLSPDLTLVTYRVRGDHGESRHASIWDLSSEPPQMRFHQSTVVPDADRGR